MEKKLKFSEFAELIGVTAKTVYKMKNREEIKTVIERVNGREIQLVVTTLDEIEKFKLMNGKGADNNGNCEDILTDYEYSDNVNNYSQTRNNLTVNEMFDKVMIYNDEYTRHIEELCEKHNNQLKAVYDDFNNRTKELSEQLLNSEKQIALLEDKAGREGFYLNEINELKKENEYLLTSKDKVKNFFLTVCVGLLLVLGCLITFIVVNKPVNNGEEQKNQPVQQEFVQEVQKPIEQTVNKKSPKGRK